MDKVQKKSFEMDKPPTTIFILMALTNILINLDHGILPACTNQMKNDFDIFNTQLGFLGSTVYIGIVAMGLFAGNLYQHFNSKLLTLSALFALQLSLGLFVIKNNKYLAFICRFVTGMCQVFLIIYYPVWIDKFGQDKKTMWLTILQICVPLGIFIGYGITSIFNNVGQSYKYSFYVQIGLVAIFIVFFMIISRKKLDTRRKQEEEEQSHHQISNCANQTLQSSFNQHSQELLTHKKKSSVLKMIKKLFKSKMYLVGTFTMSIILFVSTGIQFWLTDYFINQLNFPPSNVNIAYAVVSITGPTSGCGIGGYITSKMGGYENPKTIYYVFLFACFGIGSACVIPWMTNFYVLIILLWTVLFFGGAMLPGLTGIMMVSVPAHMRSFGNSTGEIIKNCIGFLPAPFLYGWFNSMFGPKSGIILIMYWGLFAPILLALGSIYRYFQLAQNTLERQEKMLAQTCLEDDEEKEEQKDKKHVENDIINPDYQHQSFKQRVSAQVKVGQQQQAPKEDNYSTNSDQNIP